MSEATDPARILPPLKYDYVAFSKLDFTSFVHRVGEVLQEEYEEPFNIEIECAAFDTPFQTPEVLIKTLTKNEWQTLTTLTIRYFRNKDRYRPTVEIALGRPNGSHPMTGFYCVVKSGKTSQKIAVKESINLLIEDFRRKPLNGALVGLLVAIGGAIIGWLLHIIVNKYFPNGNGVEFISLQDSLLLGSILGFVAGLLGFQIAMPVIEFMGDDNKTHWNKLKGYLIGFSTVIGLFLAVLSLV
jgi:hypothetical protein